MGHILGVENVPAAGKEPNPQDLGIRVLLEEVGSHVARLEVCGVWVGAYRRTQVGEAVRVNVQVTVAPADVDHAEPARLASPAHRQPVVLVYVQAHVATLGEVERRRGVSGWGD